VKNEERAMKSEQGAMTKQGEMPVSAGRFFVVRLFVSLVRCSFVRALYALRYSLRFTLLFTLHS
jgi:hypothetical protein